MLQLYLFKTRSISRKETRKLVRILGANNISSPTVNLDQILDHIQTWDALCISKKEDITRPYRLFLQPPLIYQEGHVEKLCLPTN